MSGMEGTDSSEADPGMMSSSGAKTGKIMKGESFLDEGPDIVGNDVISRARLIASVVLLSLPFQGVMTTIILLNLVLVVLQADYKAANEHPLWLDTIGSVPLIIYSTELTFSLFVWGRRFFDKSERIFDFAIVSIDLLTTFLAFVFGNLPSASALRVLRLLKLVRTVRVLTGFHELYLIVAGLAAAMRALMWGCFLLFFMLLMWSVIAVEVLLPYQREVFGEDGNSDLYGKCTRCAHAFSSVFEALFTFVQLILLGHGWEEICLPIIEYQPWTAMLLIFIFVSVTLGVLNLILSAVLDNAAEARDNDKGQILLAKMKEYKDACHKFKTICQILDSDCSGTLTFEEMREGFESNAEFHAILHMMDIEREDLWSIYKMLDTDGSGEVNYDEFAENMHRLKTQDTHSMVMLIRCHLADANGERKIMMEQLEAIKVCMQQAALEREAGSAERKLVLKQLESVQRAQDQASTERAANAGQGKQVMTEIVSIRQGLGLPGPSPEAVPMPQHREGGPDYLAWADEHREKKPQTKAQPMLEEHREKKSPRTQPDGNRSRERGRSPSESSRIAEEGTGRLADASSRTPQESKLMEDVKSALTGGIQQAMRDLVREAQPISSSRSGDMYSDMRPVTSPTLSYTPKIAMI